MVGGTASVRFRPMTSYHIQNKYKYRHIINILYMLFGVKIVYISEDAVIIGCPVAEMSFSAKTV